MFPNYHRALPAHVQQRVRDQAAARNCFAEGEGLFLHAYALVTKDERVQTRLDQFRNQYSFARNMSFAFIVATVSILIAHWHGPQLIRLRAVCLLASPLLACFIGI